MRKARLLCVTQATGSMRLTMMTAGLRWQMCQMMVIQPLRVPKVCAAQLTSTHCWGHLDRLPAVLVALHQQVVYKPTTSGLRLASFTILRRATLCAKHGHPPQCWHCPREWTDPTSLRPLQSEHYRRLALRTIGYRRCSQPVEHPQYEDLQFRAALK